MDGMNNYHSPELPNESYNRDPYNPGGLPYSGEPLKKLKGNRFSVATVGRLFNNSERKAGSSQPVEIPSQGGDGRPFTIEVLRTMFGDSVGIPEGLTQEQWGRFKVRAELVARLLGVGRARVEDPNNPDSYDLAA